MSKTWYPKVNLEKCSECLVCMNFCKHGVYAEKNGRPVIVNPEGCVHGCKGCLKQCPTGAIEYVGDNEGSCSSGACSCGC